VNVASMLRNIDSTLKKHAETSENLFLTFSNYYRTAVHFYFI